MYDYVVMTHDKEYNKKYYQENKEQIKKWCKAYREKHKDRFKEYMRQYYLKNKEWLEAYKTKWVAEHREQHLLNKKKYNFEHKTEHMVYARNKHNLLLLKVGKGKLECVRCGCKDPRFLEINHKFGGGHKELKRFGKFYTEIEDGVRTTEDLELLCRPCNHIHYLELKFKQEIPLKVISINNDWESEL